MGFRLNIPLPGPFTYSKSLSSGKPSKTLSAVGLLSVWMIVGPLWLAVWIIIGTLWVTWLMLKGMGLGLYWLYVRSSQKLLDSRSSPSR